MGYILSLKIFNIFLDIWCILFPTLRSPTCTTHVHLQIKQTKQQPPELPKTYTDPMPESNSPTKLHARRTLTVNSVSACGTQTTQDLPVLVGEKHKCVISAHREISSGKDGNFKRLTSAFLFVAKSTSHFPLFTSSLIC